MKVKLNKLFTVVYLVILFALLFTPAWPIPAYLMAKSAWVMLRKKRHEQVVAIIEEV